MLKKILKYIENAILSHETVELLHLKFKNEKKFIILLRGWVSKAGNEWKNKSIMTGNRHK